jgi:hypothetical protein
VDRRGAGCAGGFHGGSRGDIDAGYRPSPERQITLADVSDRDGFAQAYARARSLQVETWSDELLAIADDDRLEPNDRRVRLDTRKWLMSKLNPSRYGDKVQVGGDPDNPVRHIVEVLDLSQLSGPELDALERFADARLAAKDVLV